MANSTTPSSLSDFGDLEESLNAFYHQTEAMVSESSIPSTATTSDLPGLGRNLGNLYSYLGKRLENVINRFSERRGHGPKATDQYDSSLHNNFPSPSALHLEGSFDSTILDDEGVLSESTIPSTATASDLPGAGLTLGKLYSLTGKRLENFINVVAERCGYGPQQIEKRVILLLRIEDSSFLSGSYTVRPRSKEDKRLRKDLQRLVAYASSPIVTNRDLAFKAIVSIATYDPYFYGILRAFDASRILGLAALREQEDGPSDNLLSPSRKALISVVESRINAAGHEFSVLNLKMDEMSPERYKKAGAECYEQYHATHVKLFGLLIKYTGSRSQDESFLAIRHLMKFANGWAPASFWSGNPAGGAEFTKEIDREYGVLAQTIYHKMHNRSHPVDWTALGTLVLYMQNEVDILRLSDEPKQWCSQAVKDAVVQFEGVFPPDMWDELIERPEVLEYYSMSDPEIVELIHPSFLDFYPYASVRA